MTKKSSKVSRREALKITAVSGVSLALGGTLVSELVRRARLQRVSQTQDRLGTLVNVTVVHPDVEEARAMVAGAFGEISRLEDILSRHQEGTALARLNAEGSLRDAPMELIEVLHRAESYSALTGGAFDVTMAPLLELYTMRAERGQGIPSDREIESALTSVGYERMRIEDMSVVFEEPGMSVTLDGIAKGFVVDRTVAVLVAGGAERVMVDAGGDIASGGREVGDEPWRIGIQHPHDMTASVGQVRLAGDAVATSGDYQQAFTEDRTAHHIIDPRTGRSPELTSSATVMAATAMDADALSTAVLVLGPTEGVDLLERIPAAEGVIVSKQGDLRSTRGMKLGA
jgi:thiamine biosynthesis lipoprotein